MDRKEWKGPKEWRPLSPDLPLLTHAERLDLEVLRRRLRTRGEFGREAIGWLIKLVDRLASTSPAEYDFPKYLGLVNKIHCQGFLMRHLEGQAIQKSTTLSGSLFSRMTLLEHDFSEQPCDATAVIRPWVRLGSGAPSPLVETVRKGTLTMTVDDSYQVLKGPVDQHLIGPSGEIYHKVLWKVMNLNQGLFPAVLPGADSATVTDQEIGIMCINGTRLRIDLYFSEPLFFDGELTMVTGLVAARYTTKP